MGWMQAWDIPGEMPQTDIDFAPAWLFTVGITPEQWNAMCERRSAEPGIAGLIVAIIEDAIRCYCRPLPLRRGGSKGLLAQEAAVWIKSGDSGPFSFNWCVEALGGDANRARAAILGSRGPILARRTRQVTNNRIAALTTKRRAHGNGK
jgi:hypothetical protein